MILHKVRSLFGEFQVVNFRPSPIIVKEVEIWINPKPPWYKSNTDGAVFQQQQASRVGTLIWDHAGRVVAALSKKLHYLFGPLEAEAKVFEEAVDFA